MTNLGLTKEYIQRKARIALAPHDFFRYCNLTAPDFYKADRQYLIDLAAEMQGFYESGDDDVLIINIGPRHGKSRTAGKFVEWVLGKNKNTKIMTGSYNETLSTTFSKSVRNAISEVKADPNVVVFSDIFKNVAIKRGDGAMNLWGLEGGHQNYLATSPGGTATGFGADIIIVDDLIKNAEEANNSRVLDMHWDWFCFTGNTMVSTPHGDVCISDIRAGDKVLTYNHSQCIIEEGIVKKVKSKQSQIYKVRFNNGKEIETTGNHKFYTNKGYRTIEEILYTMRGGLEQGETVLFSHMPKQSKGFKITQGKLLKLWKRNKHRKKKQTNKILFYGLPTSTPNKELELKICNVEQNKGRSQRQIQTMSKMQSNNEFTGTPYRPRHKEQQIEQLDSIVPIVPYVLSQATRLPSDDIRTVYDIEVEGNHNFFANSMLVHNCNTMLSRLETGGKIILIMTRWHTKDLAGRALKELPELGFKVRHVNLKTHQGNGVMLCDDVLTYEEYVRKTKAMSPEIASANYQQEPIDLKGRLYNLGFKTYTRRPTFKRVESYTDTADTGNDYLATYIYGVTFDNEAYILDVIFTKAPMEETEPLLAEKLNEHAVNIAYIESNNGGRGYARAVERILKEQYQTNKTKIVWFHQSKNKIARILTNATWVMEHIYFPEGWENRWDELSESLNRYQREGKNEHDDAEDAITGIAEMISKPPSIQILTPKNLTRRRR